MLRRDGNLILGKLIALSVTSAGTWNNGCCDTTINIQIILNVLLPLYWNRTLEMKSNSVILNIKPGAIPAPETIYTLELRNREANKPEVVESNEIFHLFMCIRDLKMLSS